MVESKNDILWEDTKLGKLFQKMRNNKLLSLFGFFAFVSTVSCITLLCEIGDYDAGDRFVYFLFYLLLNIADFGLGFSFYMMISINKKIKEIDPKNGITYIFGKLTITNIIGVLLLKFGKDYLFLMIFILPITLELLILYGLFLVVKWVVVSVFYESCVGCRNSFCNSYSVSSDKNNKDNKDNKDVESV